MISPAERQLDSQMRYGTFDELEDVMQDKIHEWLFQNISTTGFVPQSPDAKNLREPLEISMCNPTVEVLEKAMPRTMMRTNKGAVEDCMIHPQSAIYFSQ